MRVSNIRTQKIRKLSGKRLITFLDVHVKYRRIYRLPISRIAKTSENAWRSLYTLLLVLFRDLGFGPGGGGANDGPPDPSSGSGRKITKTSNIANLQEAWAVSRRVSKDDWLDW